MSAYLLGLPIFLFMIIAFAYFIGDFVGTKTKAWVPGVFITAIVFLLGYWTFFPKEIVPSTGLGQPFAGVAIMLILTHMGTTMSIKELAAQWKVIVNCLFGLVGMILFCLLIAARFVDWNYIVSGLPPLTGGIVAATMMQQAAADLGLERASILAICMYCAQGFAGYPITAIMLKKEGRKLLADFRGGKVKGVAGAGSGAIDADAGKFVVVEAEKKKLIPPVPAKYNTTALSLAKIALSAVIANLLSRATGGAVNAGVLALIVGVVLCQIGFLDKNILKQNGCMNFVFFALMIYIFDGLKNATPAMLAEILGPLFIIIVIGVVGMLLFCFVISKVLKISPYMACATALTALYGFPPNYMLTDEATTALSESPEEKQYLMDNMMPPMIVGGFTTVTITSVIIAGIFIPMLR